MIEDQEEINIECAILQGRIAYLQQTTHDKYKGDYKPAYLQGYKQAEIDAEEKRRIAWYEKHGDKDRYEDYHRAEI